MPLDETLLAAEQQMQKAAEFLRQELRAVRTGRASAGLVDGLKVEVPAYGTTLALRELANIAVAAGNVIVLKPFDPATLRDIERAIEKSELGINPQNDGKLIRLPVPPLSTERRQQLVAHVRQLAEQQKIAVRNARRDANKALEADKKDKKLTEDDLEHGQKRVQQLTDQYCAQIDQLVADKSREIMQV